MNPSTSSNFYLERVGFEAKVNLRHNLKVGKNLVGRSDTHGVDIGFNSLNVSRNHCTISVFDDSVVIEDLNSLNGTTINGVNKKGEKVLLIENDLIGIIGGSKSPSELIGNYNFSVYRLRKYTSDNIQTFEIEDDEPAIELSDDEDNVICLDSDGETVDIKEENDLEIQLSRNFNLEIKKELEDFAEDWEELCITVKSEQCDVQPDETDENLNQINGYFSENPKGENDSTVNAQQSVLFDCVPAANELINDDNDSDDSNQTVCFATLREQRTDQVTNSPDTSDTQAPLSDHTNFDKNVKTRLDLKLKETINKINDSEEKNRKRRAAMVYAKPVEKRRKTKDEDHPQIGKPRSKTEEDKKAKLKSLASTSQNASASVEDKQQSTHTTPKVKFTPHNRGSFLTDLAQTPASPRELQQKHKAKDKSNKPATFINLEKANVSLETVRLSTAPTPPELEQKIYENMHFNATPQPPNVQIASTEFAERSKPVEEVDEDRGMCEIESLLHEMEANGNQLIDFQDDCVDMDTHDNEENGNDDEEDDVEQEEAVEQEEDVEQEDVVEEEDVEQEEDDDTDINFLYILLRLPPETDTIKVIETVSKPANLKSILKSNTQTNAATTRVRRVTFKETGFQYDPRHKIISDITSYDHVKCETVDAFCRCVDTNISSFADSYDDYKEYRNTLVSLMMVELWKEIELEYINSKIHNFTAVTINDKNIEKRGEGRRMVFHCQADSLYKSQSICDGHLVFAMCEHNGKEMEFLALITSINYSNKIANQKLAYFTMETSVLTEILPVDAMRIRPITVITNTLNSFNAIYNLKKSPLKQLILNPLSEEIPSHHTPKQLTYKTYDPLDDTQRRILNTVYRRCINLDVPNVSLLDGAAGTGKSCMIVNLALQLVYGDELPKPLRILICSKTNGGIDDLTKKLISIRDNTSVTTKIQLVRFGLLEHMDSAVQRVSVQRLKESQQFTSYEDLEYQRDTLKLKIAAANLKNDSDLSTDLCVLQRHLFKVDALLGRFEGLEKKKLRDAATFILNSCDIICTTLASIPKLQNYVTKVDVCIIDEATQCSEPLTLLPVQFGMPSLVLVGDSQLVPLTAYSQVVKEMNYGNSLFARFQKLFLGKFGSPVFEMNFQYRIHQEILMWPNHQFYKSRLVPHKTVKDDSFPIAPYKVISYSSEKGMKESDNIMLVVKVLLGHVDWKAYTFAMICTNFKQNSVLKNKLRDYPYISTYTADSYIGEKDVVIIWISEEHSICNLAHQQILNAAVTRAKKSLLIFGGNLQKYKNRAVWRSLLENANNRKCMQHFKTLSAEKICNTLSKNVLTPCASCCL